MSVRLAWKLIGFGLILLVVWLSLTPRPIHVPVEQGDKFGHLVTYGTLMFWFAHLDGRARGRLGYAIAFTALGIALEAAQGLTDYRVFEAGDIVVNGTGVVLGWIIAPPRGPDLLSPIERRLDRD